MSRLPTVTPRQTVVALKKAGFEDLHQRGRHVHPYHPQKKQRTIIPMHAKDLHRGLLKAILKQAGLSEEQFRDLM
jgi:predicted RNA binding protein YcfA (HicA-like mRNA interferase family)